VAGEGDFLPLGDTAIIGTDPDPQQNGTLLFAPVENSDALAHPTDFQWVLDDHGSHNSRDIAYWKPIAPEGYAAVGLCFGPAKPDVTQYWCVHRKYLQPVKAETYWSDHGAGWESHNGNLISPAFGKPEPIKASEGQMLLIPPTFSNPEAGTPSLALIVEPAFLDIDSVKAGDYNTVMNASQGSETQYGVRKIAIVPHTAISDTLFQKAENSPFYFIADEPIWRCIQSSSTPAGGEYEVSFMVGTKEADSREFSKHTSITVSAETGVEYGGASAKISASYTQEFGMETSHSEEKSTEIQKSTTLTLDKKPITWFWQRSNDISVYRTDGTLLSSIAYGTNDIRFSYANN